MSLVPNSHAQFWPLTRDGKIVAVRVEAPRLEQPLLVTTVLASEREGVFNELLTLCMLRKVGELPSASSYDAALCEELRALGAYVFPGECTSYPPLEPFSDEVHSAVDDWKQAFGEQCHVMIPRLMSESARFLLATYANALATAGYFAPSDRESPGRLWRKNDEQLRSWHEGFVPFVSSIVGETVRASFNYIAVYESNAGLHPHVDRAECEWALSCRISDGGDWPLRLHLDRGIQEIALKPGAALLYKGRHIEHSRAALPEGQTCAQLMFFYVRPDFVGRSD